MRYLEVENFWRDYFDPRLGAEGFEVISVATVTSGCWKRFYYSKQEPYWLSSYVEVKAPALSRLHVCARLDLKGIGEPLTAFQPRANRLNLDGMETSELNRPLLERLADVDMELFLAAKERIRDHFAPPSEGS